MEEPLSSLARIEDEKKNTIFFPRSSENVVIGESTGWAWEPLDIEYHGSWGHNSSTWSSGPAHADRFSFSPNHRICLDLVLNWKKIKTWTFYYPHFLNMNFIEINSNTVLWAFDHTVHWELFSKKVFETNWFYFFFEKLAILRLKMRNSFGKSEIKKFSSILYYV